MKFMNTGVLSCTISCRVNIGSSVIFTLYVTDLLKRMLEDIIIVFPDVTAVISQEKCCTVNTMNCSMNKVFQWLNFDTFFTS